MRKICIIFLIILLCFNNNIHAGIALGGKFTSDFEHSIMMSGDSDIFNGLSHVPHLTNLALTSSQNSWIPWGAGFSCVLGSMIGNPLNIELLFGRSPRNDLKMRVSADWHLLTYYPLEEYDTKSTFNGLQIYLGIGGGITTYFDTKKSDIYDHIDYISSFRVPCGIKFFVINKVEIFSEFVPSVGWHYSEIREKKEKRDAQGFIKTSGSNSSFNYMQTNLSVSIGAKYWFH